jgi:hypothetical protein
MDCEEALRTAKANLKGHQDRSLNYIRIIDEQREEIQRLRKQVSESNSRADSYADAVQYDGG